MASVFTATNTALQRSHSSSNLPDYTSYEFKHTQADVKLGDLPRAASYTCLPVFESPSYTTQDDHLPSFPDTPLPVQTPKEGSQPNKQSEGVTSGIGALHDERPRIGRTKSLVSRPRSWIQRAVNSSPHRRDSLEPKVPPLPRSTPVAKAAFPDKSKSTQESFATSARKTWISTSRSPSPSSRLRKKIGDDSTIDYDESTALSSVTSSSLQKSSLISSRSDEVTVDVTSTGLAKTSNWKIKKSLHRKSILPQMGSVKIFDHRTVNTSDTSLPGSLSEKESTTRGSIDSRRMGKTFPKEKPGVFGSESSRKKDELWSAFRSLELDYQKFQSKSSALKTNVVRSTLLPFLRNYAQHASNKSLRPEDLDKRVSILDKWWTGLLEMLDSHNNQHVSGVDRPVILEAITNIMTRPEWRLPPSNLAPLAERNVTPDLPRSRSSGSLSSGASQFLADSVYHNVRNMFIQNLLSQMSLVVDKMSLRTAPASLVTFCGKAVAYAFFFCPGVADILVRIWNIAPDTIRRIADEFGLVRRHHSDNDEIVIEFPPSLHSMGWKSPKALITQLRQRLIPPPALARVLWYGPWISRWCGRDSDLFFVFCKHYHILLEEFLPSSALLIDKARAPGFVLVHAQILAALDATIHRQPSNDAAAAVLAMSFDDVMSDANASVVALPLPPSSNVTRLMAENRLIMLLRDFLSERPSESQCARHTFAEAFSKTMRAAARKTSQFDHNACFILCDFMEEALTIYLRFQNALDTYVEYIDWAFWLIVCQKMLDSQNTMTEIRLFSFIFGAWNMIAADAKRKEALAFEWIIADDIFQKYFLHWCPMVRAYYMRLLCWRVCRFDGESSQIDTKIYGAAFDRLRGIWSNYLYQKEQAEKNHTLPPSIAPCHPAPGRRLLIIRNDNQIPAASLFLGFDGIVQPFSANQSTAYKRHSFLAGIVRSDSTDFNVAADPPANSKKRWSLLGKIMPFSSPDGPGHGSNSSPQTQHKQLTPLEQARQATASARMRSSLQTMQNSSSTSSLNSLDDSRPSSPSNRLFSFKFSLEWTPPSHAQQGFQSSKSNKSLHTLQLSSRLSPPRLPAPAHAFLVGTVPGTASEIMSKATKGLEAKYAGRALAEWSMIVKECNNFVERRKSEGVPGLKAMEVPTLGVEGFRKYC